MVNKKLAYSCWPIHLIRSEGIKVTGPSRLGRLQNDGYVFDSGRPHPYVFVSAPNVSGRRLAGVTLGLDLTGLKTSRVFRV